MRNRILIVVAFLTLVSTTAYCYDCNNMKIRENKRYVVEIETSKGDISIVLLNKTPLHLANFLNNIDKKVYDNMKFHRVIRKFMIQIGDPNTKDTSYPRSGYGERSQGDNVLPEYDKNAIHTIGAVGMARESDDLNPERLSSGSHFYIVTGANKLTSVQIDEAEQSSGFKYTPEQRHSYLRDGGQARLDGRYVVFGYTLEGMDVVKIISELPTNQRNLPNENVLIEKIKIKKLSNKKLFKRYGYNTK